jgi:TolA-binding protein
MKIDKIYISLTLSLLCLIFSIWSYLHSRSKESSNSDTIIEQHFEDQRKSIEKQNEILVHKIDSLQKKISKNQFKVVTIENQKKEIQYVYQNKINQIDDYHTNAIVNDFNLLFSKGNFRKQ